MSAIYDSNKLVVELKAILEANTDIDFVSTEALVPLASETNGVAIYIAVESIAIAPRVANVGVDAYDRHMLISVYLNVDTSDTSKSVFDITDSVERSILEDGNIWTSLLDRDVEAINFDNQEHLPMRSITMLLDIRYRLKCLAS